MRPIWAEALETVRAVIEPTQPSTSLANVTIAGLPLKQKPNSQNLYNPITAIPISLNWCHHFRTALLGYIAQLLPVIFRQGQNRTGFVFAITSRIKL
ncbi:hypothetical protein FCV25MIE_13678 [Fagus crenata]